MFHIWKTGELGRFSCAFRCGSNCGHCWRGAAAPNVCVCVWVCVCVCFFPACGSEQCQGLLQRLKLSKVRLCLDSADYCGLREL